MAELMAATNSIRWSLGPSGTVVSFAEDVGLPNFFNTGPCRSHILPSFCSGWSNIDMKVGVLYLCLCSPGLVSSLHMELSSQLSGGLRSLLLHFPNFICREWKNEILLLSLCFHINILVTY
jgi:hypothetical protein